MMKIYKYSFQLAIILILLLQTAIAISETILDKGHNLGQLRGAMIGSDVSESDILELGNQWQGNHIRWQLNWADASSNSGIEAYWTWLVVELEKLDNILIYSRNAGIKVLIDLHTTPGGRDSSDANKIFTDQEALNNFYEVWRTIARRYKDNTVVWGYDLVNEPVEKSSGQLDTWHNIATHAAQEIRAIDSEHSIIVEPAHYGLPEGFNSFSPINVSGIVYSVHVYDPHRFTHQGLGDFGATGVSYPGFIDGEYWDKNRLIESLAAVLGFQNKYSVPIYVGEFSAIRWAPGDSAFNYISDAIDIFESYGWDWAYHAFREWDGWSVEYPAGTTASTPASSTTKRENLLRTWFSLNNKPDNNPPYNSKKINISPLEMDTTHINYFLLKISSSLTVNASVDYQTQDGAAIAGIDYIATSGTAVIKAGETTSLIPVTIIGDNILENDENFYLTISNPLGASFPPGIEEIKKSRLIINDDN